MGRGRRDRNKWLASLGILVAALFAFLLPAKAQDYPNRPVKIIVPFPAGGTADVMPRLIGDWLSRKWGQPVIIENKPGAAGNIGTTEFSKVDPDGYTLLSAPPPPLVINQSLYPKLNFDASTFEPIVIISRVPNSLVVNPKVTAKNVAEFIAMAKAQPGKITSATQGNGTTSHLTAELFKSMAGGREGPLSIAHVPYKGTAPALTDLLGGQVDLMFDNLGVSLPHVRSGKLKALAVASRGRVASLPGTPALAETLPGFEAVAWFGIVGPPKTSPAIAQKVAAGVAQALKSPELLKRLEEMAAEPMGLSPAETAAFMKQETERWGRVIRTANVKLD